MWCRRGVTPCTIAKASVSPHDSLDDHLLAWRRGLGSSSDAGIQRMTDLRAHMQIHSYTQMYESVCVHGRGTRWNCTSYAHLNRHRRVNTHTHTHTEQVVAVLATMCLWDNRLSNYSKKNKTRSPYRADYKCVHALMCNRRCLKDSTQCGTLTSFGVIKFRRWK